MSPTLIPAIAPDLHPRTALDENFGTRRKRDWFEPRPSDPVYFFLYPTAQAARQIARLTRRLCTELNLHSDPPKAERFHVTLLGPYFLGRLTRKTCAAIDEAASAMRMPPFLASFDCARNFAETGGVLVLCGEEGVDGIRMLQNELAVAMRMIGLRSKRQPSDPHIMLLYGHCQVSQRMVEDTRWTVREFALVCSLEGRHRHRVLATWPLRTAARFD
jgi:2'-5' RNA ligase